MKCLILGGGGFIGSHLSDKLLNNGYAVRIFERPRLKKYRTFSPSENIEWFEGDFLNTDDLEQAVRGCDVIYHLISTTLPKSSNDNPIYDVETNVIGSLNLLQIVRKNKVKKIIFLSSGGTIYGNPKITPINESDPLQPLCSYGIVKLTIEKYLHLYNKLYDMPYCVLRFANPFGERQPVSGAQGAVSVFLHKALKGEKIEIWGDGNVIRDYFYIDDATDAMLRVLECDCDKHIFNIGSGEGHSLNDILVEIETLLGHPVKRTYSQGRPLDAPVNVLDITRAKQFLQWSPAITFQEGLARTLMWLKEVQ